MEMATPDIENGSVNFDTRYRLRDQHGQEQGNNHVKGYEDCGVF